MANPITDFSQLDLSKQYTFKDYLSWRFQERVELFKGFVAKMSPAPNRLHQDYSGNLNYAFKGFLKGKKCKVYAAPFDVYLPTKDKKTVVQPDIVIICDTNKLQLKGCVGAPDIVIEILSPGNTKKEMKDKYALYEEAGVKEYWVVFPAEQVVQIYELRDGIFQSRKPLANGDSITTPILEGFEMEVDEIFNI
jgi:Uma2 family endonuclease